MGTNFYMMNGTHIGKRSASGMYCWDCRLTLCEDGESGVHLGKSKWYDSCPSCGKKPISEGAFGGSTGRELGFNKKPFVAKKGVASCSSFRFAVESDRIERLRKVKDEYGRKYSKEKFKKMLLECPIKYYDFIGKEFS